MKYFNAVFLFSLALLTGTAMANSQNNNNISISKSSDRETIKTLEANFTGRVWLDPLFLKPTAPQKVSVGEVTFEPSAHTAWHTHPIGQTLYITAGNGWVQEWGKPKILVQAGDVVNFLPNVKHWHGATNKSSMTHIAIQEADNKGTNVVWLEKVSDQDYYGK